MLRQHGRGHPGAHSAHLDDADDVLPEMAAGYVFLLWSVCADAVTLFPELLPSQLILMVGHGWGHCEGRPGADAFHWTSSPAVSALTSPQKLKNEVF